MDSFRTYGPLAALMTLLLVVSPANAAIVATYTSAEALVNASESPAQITFEDIINEGPYQLSSPLIVNSTQGTLNVQSYFGQFSGDNLWVRQNPNPTWTGNYAEGAFGTPGGFGRITIFLPPNIRFLGSNVMLLNGGAGDVEVRVRNSNDEWHSQTVTALAGFGSTNGYANAAFLGFHSDTPIVQWDIYSRAFDRVVVDNLYVAQNPFSEPPPPPPPPQGTPDAATHLLCGGGILLIISRKMRKHLQAHQVAI